MKLRLLLIIIYLSGCTVSASIDWIPQNKDIVVTEKRLSERHEERGFFSKFFR